jgi:hypothetical protein
MAKKSRRARKRAGRSITPTTSQPTPAPVDEQAMPDPHEYRYVITDLRHVAILAIAIFVLLVALSFFVH